MPGTSRIPVPAPSLICIAVLMLSSFEGYGLPVVEAMGGGSTSSRAEMRPSWSRGSERVSTSRVGLTF